MKIDFFQTTRWIACGAMLAGAGLFAPSAGAQDFNRTGPKELPPQRSGAELPNTAPTAQPDDTRLLRSLKALVFVQSSQAVKLGGIKASGLVTNGIDLLEKPEFKTLAAPYLGQPLTLGRLNQLVREIVIYYRNHDHPVVDVVVPEQDITNGAVQLVVLEGRVGTVKASGNRWFSSRTIEGQVRLQPGDRIFSHRLLDDIDWLNQNPFRTVDVVFAPGGQSGETDLTLRVQDRFPLRIYAGYEDTGNDLTGQDRWYAGFNWGNAFGLDQQLNYQFTTSSDFQGLLAHSLSYTVPLPWRHKLEIFGVLSESHAESGPFSIDGSGRQASLRYIIPLPTLSKGADYVYSHELSLGFDWKRSNNFLEFDVLTASDTTTDIGQFTLGYRSSLRDPWGAWNFQGDMFYSPGGWFPHQDIASYEAARAGADDEFFYTHLTLGRVTRLPGNFTLNNQFTLQLSNGNLLPTEQLAIGGYDSVRGYDERVISDADEGFLMRHELRTPPIKLLGHLSADARVQDQLQFLAFWDYAIARPRDPQPGEDHSTVLSSVGAGIRYSLSDYVTVRADYGFQLTDVGDQDHTGRWHVGVSVSY